MLKSAESEDILRNTERVRVSALSAELFTENRLGTRMFGRHAGSELTTRLQEEHSLLQIGVNVIAAVSCLPRGDVEISATSDVVGSLLELCLEVEFAGTSTHHLIERSQSTSHLNKPACMHTSASIRQFSTTRGVKDITTHSRPGQG